MAKRPRSEIWPLCIYSVQGHSRSNPSYASDRQTWVSYRHLIQTLVVLVTCSVCEIIDLKVGIFWRSIEQSVWENWTVLNYHKYIFWKVKHPSGNRRKNFSQRAKMWRRGWKMTDFSRFFGRCDLVFELFKKISPQYKSRTRRDVRAKFGANRSRDGWGAIY